MSKYSKFDVDTFNIFWVIGYIIVFAHWCQQRRQQQRSRDHNKLDFFLRKKDELKIKQNSNKIFTHKTMTHYKINDFSTMLIFIYWHTELEILYDLKTDLQY